MTDTQPIKCITVPAGLSKEGNAWKYRFSVSFQFKHVTDEIARKVFTMFPDWINAMQVPELIFQLNSGTKKTLLTIVTPPQFSEARRKALWAKIFPKEKVDVFSSGPQAMLAKAPLEIKPFFNVGPDPNNTLFDRIKKTYTQEVHSSARGSVYANEQYQAWQVFRMNYLMNDKIESTAASGLKTLADYSGITTQITQVCNDFNQGARTRVDQHRKNEALIESLKIDYNPYTAAGHLIEHFEINRMLGLLMDFYFIDECSTPESCILSAAQFANNSIGAVRINFRFNNTVSAEDAALFEQVMDTHIEFHCNADNSKRLISAVNSKMDGTTETVDRDHAEKGLLRVDDSLVTTTEVLSDLFSTEESASSLLISSSNGSKDWAFNTVAKSTRLYTKGFYIFQRNLSEYVRRGQIVASTKYFTENNIAIGHRVGVKRKLKGAVVENNLYTLCGRNTDYKFNVAGVPNLKERVLESFIRSDAGSQTQATASSTVQEIIDEKFMYWNGNHLTMENVFKAFHQPEDSKEGEDETISMLNDVFCAEHKHAPHPRLRFHGEYAFVVTNVLLNGWSIPLSDIAPPGVSDFETSSGQLTAWDIIQSLPPDRLKKFITREVLFSRNEGVNPPDLCLPKELITDEKPVPGTEGESLDHLVIRNFDTNTTTDTCSRFIAPPSTPGQLAIWHGNLDGLNMPGVKSAIWGDNAKAVKALPPVYSTDPNNFTVSFLPDPLAANLSFSFYLDSEYKYSAAKHLTIIGHDPKVIVANGTVIILDAFESKRWPNINTWKLDLITQTGNDHSKIGTVEVLRNQRKVIVRLHKGAELFAETSFLDTPAEHKVLNGLGFEFVKDELLPLSEQSNTLEDLLDSLTNSYSGRIGTMSVGRFTKYLSIARNAYFAPRRLSFTHAMQKPLIAPEYIVRTDHNIFYPATNATTAIIGIRQITFDEKNYWSIPFQGNNEMLSTIYPDRNEPYLIQSECKVLEYARFEHLNGYMFLNNAVAARTLSKTGDVELLAKWRDYSDSGDGLTDPTKPKEYDQHLEHNYEMGLLSDSAISTVKHSDDLQLLDPTSPMTHGRLGTNDEYDLNPFEQGLSKLNADIPQRDTKFRKKILQLKGYSKFSSCMPESLRNKLSEASKKTTLLIVPSNASPAVIKVHKMMPLIIRQKTFVGEIGNRKYKVIKYGNAYRLYLDGSWWNTGAEERLGIICYDETRGADLNDYKKNESLYGSVSKVGRDVTSVGDRMNTSQIGMLKVTDIEQFFHKPCSGSHINEKRTELVKPDQDNYSEAFLVSLDEIQKGLAVWVVTPQFDKQTSKWYIDTTFKETLTLGSHSPFVELKLIRYQPFGLNYNLVNPSDTIRYLFGKSNPPPAASWDKYELRKDFRLSEIITNDIIYLHPTRIIFAKQVTRRKVDLELQLKPETLKKSGTGPKNVFKVFRQELYGNLLRVDEESEILLKIENLVGETLKETVTFSKDTDKIVVKEYEDFDNQGELREIYSEEFKF